ncbi:MAG: hypothetical protein ACYS47_02315 [Planctomycetota bacterium]
MTVLLVLGLLCGCSGGSDSPPPPAPGPTPQPPPPLTEGEARLWADKATVAPDGTVVVFLDVSSGTATLGALSARVNYNRNAFQLLSLVGTDSTLGNPYYQHENTSGSIYLGWTNTSPPAAGLTGERRVAQLTFQAIGGSNVTLNLNGTLKAMGDTAFPAQDIGTGSFPRAMDIVTDVTIKAQ